MYGQSRKDVFLTLLSVTSNFATLKLDTAVVQQKRLRGLILYLPAAIIPFYIYNKVYTPLRCTLFAYIYEGRSPWIHISVVLSFRHSGIDQAVVYVYMSAGVGRLSLLILIKGQCEGLSSGISAERYLLPRLFCFHNLCRLRSAD